MRYRPPRLAVFLLACAIELAWRFTITCGFCFYSPVVSPTRRDASAALTKSRRKAQNDPTNDSSQLDQSSLTTAILRISYDGTRFTGWSSSNDQNQDFGNQTNCLPTTANPAKEQQLPTTRRRRNRLIRNANQGLPKGFVRSVEGVLRAKLAKIYGNVNPQSIVVEGCSRTDRGVHATGMVAQIYCFKRNILEAIRNNTLNATSTNSTTTSTGAVEEDDDIQDEFWRAFSIPGRRLPHPTSPTDESCFERLPMNGNLGRLAFAMNRMGPADGK